MKKLFLAGFAFAALLLSENVSAQTENAKTIATKDIIENTVNAGSYTTLIGLVTAADLVETLKGSGPFTIFTPTNVAFSKLTEKTIVALIQPENKAVLKSILTYHIIGGRLTEAAIVKAIKAGNGKAAYTTLQGGTLWATMDGKKLVLTDEKGQVSKVTAGSVIHKNGISFPIDEVLLPNNPAIISATVVTGTEE